jgi:uncharacterized membrane protein
MSAGMTTILAAFFAFIMLFVVWMKFHEHLHLHRDENGSHSNRTDLRQMFYRFSESGVFRRRPPNKPR